MCYYSSSGMHPRRNIFVVIDVDHLVGGLIGPICKIRDVSARRDLDHGLDNKIDGELI